MGVPSASSISFFMNWANERIGEMDATLVSLESKPGQIEPDSNSRASLTIIALRHKRDEFRALLDKHATAKNPALTRIKRRLQVQWNAFSAEVSEYMETAGVEKHLHKNTFTVQVAAQIKAWHEVADRIHLVAGELAIEPRDKLEATAIRMKAAAAAAERILQNMAQSRTESWSSLSAALAETRGAFDRANQAAQESVS